MDWDAYVHLAFDEIRLAGAQSPQVTRRLTAALADLETVVPPDRLPAIRRQQGSLVSAVSDAVPDSDDAAFALVADRQGIGVKASANGFAPQLTSNGAGASEPNALNPTRAHQLIASSLFSRVRCRRLDENHG